MVLGCGLLYGLDQKAAAKGQAGPDPRSISGQLHDDDHQDDDHQNADDRADDAAVHDVSSLSGYAEEIPGSRQRQTSQPEVARTRPPVHA